MLLRTLILLLGFALALGVSGAPGVPAADESPQSAQASTAPAAEGSAGKPAVPENAGTPGETPEDEPGTSSGPDTDDGSATDTAAPEEAKFDKAIANGIVLQQMTMQQVIEARGEPDRKELIPPDAELWYYPTGEVAFAQGKVTYVSLTEKRERPVPSERAATRGGRQHVARPPVDGQPPEQVRIPPVRVGDTYVYESFAPAQPSSGLTTRRTVTSTTDGKIVLSSLNLDNPRAKARRLHFDREWNLIASRSPDGSGRDYSPPLMYYDFPLFPGKTWRRTSNETDIKTGAVRIHTVSGVVKGWETVSVPAGTFRGIRVDLTTELYDPSTGERVRGTDISWYVPEVRRSVKSDTSGKSGSQRVIRLLSYDVE